MSETVPKVRMIGRLSFSVTQVPETLHEHTIRTAFQRGYNDGFAGIHTGRCPYTRNDYANAWLSGFQRGNDDRGRQELAQHIAARKAAR